MNEMKEREKPRGRSDHELVVFVADGKERLLTLSTYVSLTSTERGVRAVHVMVVMH